ncbi:hypothetical protein [Micromonospora sp. NPDC004704]
MTRFVKPDRAGWLALLGGSALGALLVVVYFRTVDFDDSWLALAPVGIAVTFAGVPYRNPDRSVALARWRYFVIAAGLIICLGVLVQAV